MNQCKLWLSTIFAVSSLVVYVNFALIMAEDPRDFIAKVMTENPYEIMAKVMT